MNDLTHRAFFGDAEHAFTLSPAMIRELEAVTGAGIGAIYQRLVDRLFHHSDMLHVIRLGLIGGGMAPEVAARLVTTYAEPTPVLEIYKLSLDILTIRFFGALDAGDEHELDESAFEDAGQGA